MIRRSRIPKTVGSIRKGAEDQPRSAGSFISLSKLRLSVIRERLF